MIKSREVLEKELASTFSRNIGNKRVQQKWIKSAEETFGMPKKVSSDYVTMRKDLIEASVFALFILASITDGKINEYFTKSEIKNLSKEKWNIEKVSFPIRFQMTKINDEQYIGRISVKELMLLKEAQLINYNENAQRTMQHIVKGKTEIFKIALNKDAVYRIMDSYESDLYIPNTITLNLPEDADFDYDEKRKQLVINEAEYLDILDGYHRYIAMSKIYSQNPDFDYEMELRVVQFEESKAKRFIWQEDQKTKMRKVDSESMDSAKISNKIVERMNNDNKFALAGQISRNKGLINAAYLSNIIDVVLLKGIKKSDERLAVINISSELMEAFEYHAVKDPDLFNVSWDKRYIYMLIYEMKYGDYKDMKRFTKDLHQVMEDSSIYAGPILKTADVTRTHKLLGKEEQNV